MKFWFLYFSLFTISADVLSGVKQLPQINIITGLVCDAKTKLPVPFANINLNNKLNGTQTDTDGKFTLPINFSSPETSLKISFIGYQTQEFSLKDLPEKAKSADFQFYLVPVSKNLSEVQVQAKARKLTVYKTGYNVGKFSPFLHNYVAQEEPWYKTWGQEVGIKIQAKKYPVSLQDFNFCLSGNGSEEVKVGLRFYNLKNNLPDQKLLTQNLVIQIPPNHTGWIKINLEKYAITLQQDFAVGIEWLNDSNKLDQTWLATASYMPRSQYNYYKKSDASNWARLNTTSFGMYVTVVAEK